MTKKPWEGRFEEKTHRSVEAFTASIDVDRRLYAYDIQGSIAPRDTAGDLRQRGKQEMDQRILPRPERHHVALDLLGLV